MAWANVPPFQVGLGPWPLATAPPDLSDQLLSVNHKNNDLVPLRPPIVGSRDEGIALVGFFLKMPRRRRVLVDEPRTTPPSNTNNRPSLRSVV